MWWGRRAGNCRNGEMFTVRVYGKLAGYDTIKDGVCGCLCI